MKHRLSNRVFAVIGLIAAVSTALCQEAPSTPPDSSSPSSQQTASKQPAPLTAAQPKPAVQQYVIPLRNIDPRVAALLLTGAVPPGLFVRPPVKVQTYQYIGTLSPFTSYSGQSVNPLLSGASPPLLGLLDMLGQIRTGQVRTTGQLPFAANVPGLHIRSPWFSGTLPLISW